MKVAIGSNITKSAPNDLDLSKRLCAAGTEHRKFMRMVHVQADITAPLYWWKEFDTYKVGTTANSCSAMHTLHKRDLTLDDFSHEHLIPEYVEKYLKPVIQNLNWCREGYSNFEAMDGSVEWLDGITCRKDLWWQMVQMLPSSLNQTRTVDLNYEVLSAMYRQRKAHKLDEWRDFCKWVETLPYAELITGEEK